MRRLFLIAVLAALAGCGDRRDDVEARPVTTADVARAEAACQAVGASMNELTAAMKAKLGTDDMRKVMAELARTPEWKRLEARLQQTSEDLARKRSLVR